MQQVLPSWRFSQQQQGIRRQRAQWAALAESPVKKQALARVCRAVTNTAREEFPRCSWGS